MPGWKAVLPVAAACAVAACGIHEVLPARSAAVPDGADISGRWRLAEKETNDRLRDAERDAADEPVPMPSSSRRTSHKPKPNRDSLVHVFLETGKTLKITQTPDGIFISFDRAVVEEYRFGEDRIISVGPVEAQRVSGWEGMTYVIETLDTDGNKLVERYHTEEGGDVLLREVSISQKDVVRFSLVQRFDRL